MSGRRLARYGGIRARVWRNGVNARRRLWGMPTAGRRALPDFLLIGAQRSGTTSLYEYLRGHPQVRWPAMVKSPHWFDTNYDRSPAWYRSHFPIASADRDWITGEASPYYLYHPHVAQRIATHLPDVRMIAVLRDPVSRAWSEYQHEVDRGYETLSFREALEAEPDRVAPEVARLAEPDYVGDGHRHFSYVGRGLYAQQLERYLRVVPESRLLILTLDELKKSPQATLHGVCDFLGIEAAPVPEVTQHNARVYNPMPDADRDWLVERFAEPNRRLEELLDRRLDWS